MLHDFMVGKTAQASGPNERVGNRRVEEWDEPAHGCIGGVRPPPAKFRELATLELESCESRQCRAPHEANNVNASPGSKLVRSQDQEVENGAESKCEQQIDHYLSPGAL